MYGTPDSELSNKTDNKIELDMGECRDPYPNTPPRHMAGQPCAALHEIETNMMHATVAPVARPKRSCREAVSVRETRPSGVANPRWLPTWGPPGEEGSRLPIPPV